MKTKKYQIKVILHDQVEVFNGVVTQKQFKEQLKLAKANYYESEADIFNEDSSIGSGWIRKSTRQFENFKVDETWINVGLSDIYFFEMTCNEGYHFTK